MDQSPSKGEGCVFKYSYVFFVLGFFSTADVKTKLDSVSAKHKWGQWRNHHKSTRYSGIPDPLEDVPTVSGY